MFLQLSLRLHFFHLWSVSVSFCLALRWRGKPQHLWDQHFLNFYMYLAHFALSRNFSKNKNIIMQTTTGWKRYDKKVQMSLSERRMCATELTHLSRCRAGTGTLCMRWCLVMRSRQRELRKRSYSTHTHTHTYTMFTDVQRLWASHKDIHTNTHNPSFHGDSILKCVFSKRSCQRPFGHTPILFLHPKCPE